ncbi:MAG TPA: D-alanine--D-alanine ligase family protein [Thermoleophilaceae bacterium]|nr:D-alanine--D-alanine ligase family protein [Thermoleophilaceae bacterium]
MRVAVLAGGRSSEHDISLASAEAVREGLAEAGHEAVDVRIAADGAWTGPGGPVALTPGGGLLDCDVAFPALHGAYGEDGVVQGLLEALDVPYVGAGVMSSALCMDKVTFKELMSAAGLPQVAYAGMREGDDPAKLDRLGLPVFVKPARMGSSVGITKVSRAADLPAALAAAFEHDPLVVVEAMSEGMEVECSVLGNLDPEASVPGEIVLDADWYDYEAKYQAGGMELVVPARLPDHVRERVRALAVDVFRRVDCAGLARCDFFVEDPGGQGRVLVNELNTMPGFTATSVYAKLFGESGVAYAELLQRLLDLALERHTRERGYRF